MFFITTKEKGMCQGMPDTCKVPAPPAPPIPTPFPNIANCNQATASTVTQKAFINGKAILTKASEIPMSSGDEAGSAGGVVSGKIKGEAVPKKFSSSTYAEGNAVVYQTCTFGQNGKNANVPAGIQADPSQNISTVAG